MTKTDRLALLLTKWTEHALEYFESQPGVDAKRMAERTKTLHKKLARIDRTEPWQD